MNSLSSTDKHAFVIVITVAHSSIDFDLKFQERIDQGVFNLFNEEVKKMRKDYHGWLIDPLLKIEIENSLWKFIRNNDLNCLATEWK